MFLTSAQLYELTGYIQPAAQIRWLRRNGIAHYIRANGHPVVACSALDSAALTPRVSGPDLDAVRVRQ